MDRTGGRRSTEMFTRNMDGLELKERTRRVKRGWVGPGLCVRGTVTSVCRLPLTEPILGSRRRDRQSIARERYTDQEQLYTTFLLCVSSQNF